jgi:hypothetical protein
MPKIVYQDFSSGVNTKLPSLIVESVLLAEEASNFFLTESGLEKMGGYFAVLTSAIGSEIEGLFRFFTATGEELIICAGGKVYRLNGATVTQLYTGATAGGWYTGALYAGNLVLCNGKDLPLVYNGTTVVVATVVDPHHNMTNVKPQYVATYAGRLFYGWSANAKNTIWTPTPNTFFDFSGTTFDILVVDGNGEITGLLPYFNQALAIYKTGCVRTLTGSVPFNLGGDYFKIAPVLDNAGCISPKTLTGVDNTHWFLSTGGVIKLQPNDTSADVEVLRPSYAVQPLFASLNTDATVLKRNIAYYDEKRGQFVIGLCLGADSTVTDWLQIDTIKGACQLRRGFGKPTAFCIAYNSVFHGESTGQLYRHNTQPYAKGVTYESKWEGKFIAHGSLLHSKHYKGGALTVEASGVGTVYVDIVIKNDSTEISKTYQVSFSDTNALIWGVGKWGEKNWASQKLNIRPLNGLGIGKAIKIRIRSTDPLAVLKIGQIELDFDYLGDRPA